MANHEKFSSLHDDIHIPKLTHEHGLGEYEDYFAGKRYAPEVVSTLTRLAQFGLDIKKLEEQGISWDKLTLDQYRELMRQTIERHYDVIFGSVFSKYMMPTFGQPTSQAEQLEDVIKLADEYQHWGINIIQSGKDITKKGPNLVIALEGADFVEKVADFKKLVDHGVRVFGIQYNKDNFLATNTGGLTKLGDKAIKYLLLENKGIDLAHSSLQTRSDVMDLAEDLGKGHLVSYTHGATTEDIDPAFREKFRGNERFLRPDELTRLIRMGGIVGLGISKPFFGSIEQMAQRIDQTCQLDNGINHLALGSDFGGVWNDLLFGIDSVDDFVKLADKLSERFGMTDEQIKKVMRHNAKKWVQKAIA